MVERLEVTVFKKAVAYRPALEPASLSERPPGTKLEKEKYRGPIKRTRGFYARTYTMPRRRIKTTVTVSMCYSG
jgi:hypothetical protein